QTPTWQRRFKQPVRKELDIFGLLRCRDAAMTSFSEQWPMWNHTACALVVLYEAYKLHCESCQVPPANCGVPGCHSIRLRWRVAGNERCHTTMRSLVQEFFRTQFSLDSNGQRLNVGEGWKVTLKGDLGDEQQQNQHRSEHKITHSWRQSIQFV